MKGGWAGRQALSNGATGRAILKASSSITKGISFPAAKAGASPG